VTGVQTCALPIFSLKFRMATQRLILPQNSYAQVGAKVPEPAARGRLLSCEDVGRNVGRNGKA